MTRRAVAISFKPRTQRHRGRRQRQEAERHVTRPATVAKWLALAHIVDGQIRRGDYRDYADASRAHGLSRARVSQIMSLLRLATDIQEEILVLRFPAGKEPLSERALWPVVKEPLWEKQRVRWRTLKQKVGIEPRGASRGSF